MENFVASVQYGDWKGTAAADDADQRDIQDLLKSKGAYDPKSEIVLAVDIWIGENRGGKAEAPFVRALILDVAGHDNAVELVQSTDGPLPVKKVDIEISTEEFIGLFKRFNVMLTRSGLDLSGRTYTYTE